MSAGKWLLMLQRNCCIHLEGSGSTCAGWGVEAQHRTVDKDNRMGYAGGKGLMEICSVVGSGNGHNANNCVFSHKGIFIP